MKRLLPTLITLALVSACVVNANGNVNAGTLTHEHKQLTLNAKDLRSLVANTGAGDLTIIADANRSDISVEAEVYYHNLADVQLKLEQRGNNAYLQADMDGPNITIGFGESPYIDLVVHVPASLMLELDDGSGDVQVQGFSSNIRIHDGSGDLAVDGAADAVISDGSGDLVVRRITGALTLDDGSGELTISDVKGAVSVDDGSGDLSITNAGDVTINDGSGDISVSLAASLTVPNSGSGDISYQQIRGKVVTDEEHDSDRRGLRE